MRAAVQTQAGRLAAGPAIVLAVLLKRQVQPMNQKSKHLPIQSPNRNQNRSPSLNQSRNPNRSPNLFCLNPSQKNRKSPKNQNPSQTLL